MEENYASQLQQMLLEAQSFLERLYEISDGLSDTVQPEAAKFVATFYEVLGSSNGY
jgi:hypothetical protein